MATVIQRLRGKRPAPWLVSWAGIVLLGAAALARADKVTDMSADFLEYLGSLEDGDDNWTDFGTDFADEVPAVGQHSTSSAASSASSSSTSAARKADK